MDHGSPFDDGKDPGAMRTIGEVASALGIRQHVLRYWEDQFPMLKPVKRSGGRRYYRPDDVALIARIDQLVHNEGYTLRGARLALQAGSAPAPEQIVTEVVVPPQLDEPALAASVAEASQPPAQWVEKLGRIRNDLAEALSEA